MDFINKHYEKLILLGMLLFFIFAMVNVLSIASQTSEVKDSHLRIPTREPDFKPQDASKKDFQVSTVRQLGAFIWQKGAARNQKAALDYYSDLVEFPGLAVCLVGKDDTGKDGTGCGMLVPRTLFAEKPCPNCGRILKTPPARPKMRRNVITPDDSDGDGMPNAYEESNKLDKFNPYDALYDADNDGFSNIFEMEQNTNPTIARNHPPLWFRLRFVAVRRVELPVTLQSVNTNRSDDPKRWDLQLNMIQIGRSKPKTEFVRLNGTVRIESRRYRIKKIERILADSSGKSVKKEEIVAGGVAKNEQDKAQDLSKIYLEEELDYSQKKSGAKPDKLEMQVLKPVYSSDRRPVFEDMGMPEGKRTLKVLRLGETFQMGNRQTGFSSYILRSFDEKKMTAVLERARVQGKQDSSKDELGNAMIVTKESMIPEISWVIEPIVTGVGAQEDSAESGKYTVPKRRR